MIFMFSHGTVVLLFFIMSINSSKKTEHWNYQIKNSSDLEYGPESIGALTYPYL